MAVIEKLIALEGSRGSKEVSALFDSGATYSCINPRLAGELTIIEALPRPMDFGTAKDGETVRATERVSLDFYLKGYRFSDEFVLIPNLSEEVIIGVATLQKWRLKLDFEADDILIDPRVTRLRLI
jgi:predicted aspartyl protease